MGEDIAEGGIMAQLEIIRNSGDACLGPLNDSAEGRMVGLLPRESMAH